MESTKTSYCFAIFFFLIPFKLGESKDQKVSIITREGPIGIDTTNFDFLENPSTIIIVLPAPAQHYQKTCGYDGVECNSSSLSFAKPRKNSKVDFRQKQPVFWDLAVPAGLENVEFLCRAGNIVRLNTSQKEPIVDYLCENSVGYFTKNENSTSNNTVMIVDLADGDDEVYLGIQELPTIVKIGLNGNKIFHSGQLFNEYRLDSYCNGALTVEIVGNMPAADSIVVSGNCSRGKLLNVNVMAGNGTMTIGRNVNITFSDIDAIFIEGLTLEFDKWREERWNVTLVHQHDGFFTVGSTKASGGQRATFCGAENLTWEERILCKNWWKYGKTWLVWLSVCLPIVLLICLMACVYVKTKNKRNPNTAFEIVRWSQSRNEASQKNK